MYEVKDKVAVITGGANGFGKALAERLVSKGARVVIGDILAAQGAGFVDDLNRRAASKVAVFQKCDVTDHSAMKALFQRGIDEYGRIDILVNNAGIAESIFFLDDKRGAWKKVMEIDINAVIEGTRLGLDMISSSKGGVIVNVASLAGFYPMGNAPVYSAAKHAVVGFSRAIAHLSKTRNIRVNCVAPSFAETDMVKEGIFNPEFADIVRKSGFVTIDQVVDAFLLVIEDDSLNGVVAQITPQKGITIVGKKSQRKNEQHSSKL